MLGKRQLVQARTLRMKRSEAEAPRLDLALEVGDFDLERHVGVEPDVEQMMDERRASDVSQVIILNPPNDDGEHEFLARRERRVREASEQRRHLRPLGENIGVRVMRLRERKR